MVTGKVAEGRLSSEDEDIYQMRKTLERYKKLTSKINEFLWSVFYIDGEEDAFYTDPVFKVTGYTSNELKKLPGRGSSLIYPDDAFNIRKSLSEFEKDPSQNSINLVYRITKKTGEVIWVKESIIVERNDSGDITRYDGIVSDISDFKRNEQEIIERHEKLCSMNSAKDKFISIVSHDLRAPFTSILGFAEILLNEPDLQEAEKNEYLTYIYESSQSQLQLVNYLLDWSRLQTGRIKIEPQRLKAKNLVANSISNLTGNAIRKSIEIKNNVPDDIYILADERLIMQAINNLLSNAIKFTPDGKCIEILVNYFKKGYVEFIVKDEGLGISETNKSKIFQIEQKFTSEGTKGEKGSGLGLTLVKEIVEKHSGDIWFYSETDKGSEFHFTLPEAPNTVMLVEDDKLSRIYWQKLVVKYLPNWEIIETNNGYEAMSIIMHKIPTLIITDHEMPLMNGIQLIESLRKRDETSKIPVIVIAGQLTEELKKKYSKLGVDHIFQKPFDVKLFAKCISKILS